MKHHKGQCKGGPYDGEFRNYFTNRMPVISFLNTDNLGEYLFEPFEKDSEEGIWLWKPLIHK